MFRVFLFLLFLPMVAYSATCDAGFYLLNDECVACAAKSYCPGDDKIYECNNLWPGDTSDIKLTWYKTAVTDATTPDGCLCQFSVLTPQSATASSEVWTGNCANGPDVYFGVGKHMCRPGHYPSDALDAGWTWSRCAQCTNAPDNTVYVEYGSVDKNDCPWRCADGWHINSDGTGCDKLCSYGYRALNTQSGISVPLYADKRTTPSIAVGDVYGACWADLAAGRAMGAINILYQDKVYHTVSPTTSLLCDTGYYLADNACRRCDGKYYCPGDNSRISCDTTISKDYPAPSHIYSEAGLVSADLCRCVWADLSDERRTKYNIITYCYRGPNGLQYVLPEWCRPGYYAIGPHGGNEWYRDCAPCTNGPENSHYTSYSTPSVQGAVESNCPWECDAGYIRQGNQCVAVS